VSLAAVACGRGLGFYLAESCVPELEALVQAVLAVTKAQLGRPLTLRIPPSKIVNMLLFLLYPIMDGPIAPQLENIYNATPGVSSAIAERIRDFYPNEARKW
jgi:hypothetical protein